MHVPTTPVFFDFVCPWSYAARAREKRLQREAPVKFVYVPWELNPDTPSEGAENPYPEPSADLVAYAQEAGLQGLRPPERVSNTRRALRGLFHARSHGRAGEYVDACFDAYWNQRRDLHEDATLWRVARESGLDERALVRAADDPAWDAVLLASDAWAEQLGVQSTVTYVLRDADGTQRILQGLGPYDEVRRALAEAATGPGAAEADRA